MTELNLKLIMEIILQYTHVSNHYVIHQKLIMLYVNYSKKFSGQHDHGRVEVTVGGSLVQGSGHLGKLRVSSNPGSVIH